MTAGSAAWRWTALAAALAASARAQQAADSGATAPGADSSVLPPAVAAQVATVRDLAFDFDQPGFYAVLDFVRGTPLPPAAVEASPRIEDWAELLERPRSFRGRLITIEGVVGHNKAWTLAPDARPPGPTVWQLELSGTRPQPIAVTAILTQDAADIPLGATVRLAGIFMMIRQYHGRGGQTRQAALLVAPGPLSIERASTPSASVGPTTGIALLAAAAVGLLIAWLLLRRTRPATRARSAALHAAHPAPMSLAADLADWARSNARPEGRSDDPSRTREGTSPTPPAERPP